MAKIDVDAAMKAADVIKETLVALEAKGRALQTKRAAVAARQALMYRMPLQRAELRQFILGRIDAQAASFPAQAGWEAMLHGLIHGKGMSRPAGEGEVDFTVRASHSQQLSFQDLLAGGVPAADFFQGVESKPGALDQARMCFFFGELIKQRVGAYFDKTYAGPRYSSATTAADQALSIEDRRELIAVYDGELEALDAEIAEIGEQMQRLPDNDRTRSEAYRRLGFTAP